LFIINFLPGGGVSLPRPAEQRGAVQEEGARCGHKVRHFLLSPAVTVVVAFVAAVVVVVVVAAAAAVVDVVGVVAVAHVVAFAGVIPTK
jgi:Flp pilus assembly protein TadB